MGRSSIAVSVGPEPDDPLSVRAFVEGRIGDDVINFLVDTGARTGLIPLTPTSAQLTTVGRSGSRGASGLGTDDETVIVPELQIGDLLERDVEMDRGDLGEHRHSLIGMNVFGRHRCDFRLGDGSIVIDEFEPTSSKVQQLTTGPLKTPFVNVELAGISVAACWDTGASRSVVDAEFANRNPDLVEIGTPTPGRDSGGHELLAAGGELTDCRIGGAAFNRSACVVIDLADINTRVERRLDLIIGMPIIQQARWWFDFPGRRWTVRR